jgi:BirA family transcriptional regulator, biotin operon repressor / biotin---[acetyl-CoA-carboxylase] ligase
MSQPQFPPLFSSLDWTGKGDPFSEACAQAAQGCDAGLVAFDLASDRLRAAVVFAPEVPLKDAIVMLPVCGVGFQNAFGALAPPEVGVHLEWAGSIRVNGGRCGKLTVAASDVDPATIPDWLVVGLEVQLWPANDETGHTPDETALYAEGCSDVDAVELLEAWMRHTLVGINSWADTGVAAAHREWIGIAHGVGKEILVCGKSGIFLGVDERLGLLLQQGDKTTLVPLTDLLRDR